MVQEKRISKQILALALLLAATLPGLLPVLASAQTHLSGEIGADLGQYGFSNDIFDVDLQYDSDRRLANEYLNLNWKGPLVNSYFANFNTMLKLRATQIRAEVDGETTTDFLNPDVTSYYGAVSLFPNRPLPVKIYTGKTEENNVRYEPGNRSEIEILDPGLAVVRRYATETRETGIQADWAASPAWDVSVGLKKMGNVLSRQYDFDENRNIWVDFLTLSPGVAPYYNIEVVNTIPDKDVLVFVDFAFADTVKAGGSVDLIIEEGMRDIDFVPVGLNSLSRRLNIGSDMQWKIFFNDPPGSKDMDMTNDVVTARVKYDNEGKLKSEALLEYNDGYEEVQDMVTTLKNFNNLATYDFSSTSNLSSLTTYTSNLNNVGTISSQLSKMFMQQTTAKWRKQRGLSTMFTHSFSRMSADTGTDLVKSTNNILMGKALYPTGWNRHEVSLVMNGNFLADNKDYSNNQLSAELINQLEFRKLGFRWQPKHSFKTTSASTKNPDGQTDDLESKFAIQGVNPNVGILGSLRLKGQYDWRRKAGDKNIDTKNKYLLEAGVIHKFGLKYKLMATASLDNESFDLDALEPGIELPRRDDETRRSLRLDIQASPVSDFEVGASSMWIRTNDSEIDKFALSLRFMVPKIKLPVRSFLTKETRTLEGQPPQDLLQMETKVSYNFRKIRLIIAHRLTDETLTTENYVYSEFLAKVTRNFDVF